jgi:Tfp pilus assembly protein PilF
MLEQDPQNSFARYGLAMEYAKGGSLNEAIGEFRNLLAQDQNYVAAYFHAGQTLEKLGDPEQARLMYERGIEAAPSPEK